MATVQRIAARIASRVSPFTKRGQAIQDSSGAVTITGAANNGSGLIRITAANHGFSTDHEVFITGVVGTTEANNTASNPRWIVTRISSSTFDLQGSTFTNAYTSGGTATGALVGSVDTDGFTKERLLDVYNDARQTLAQYVELNFPNHLRSWAVSENIVKNTTFQFASGSATKPTGFIRHILLRNAAGSQITILPPSQLMYVKDLEGSSSMFVFDYGTTFVSISSTTYIANASTYELWYYGVTDLTLSDLTGGSTVEVYNTVFHPLLIELAARIATDKGHASSFKLLESIVGSQ